MTEMKSILKVVTNVVDMVKAIEWTNTRLREQNQYLMDVIRKQEENEIKLRRVSKLVEKMIEPWPSEWVRLSSGAIELIKAQDDVMNRVRDHQTGKLIAEVAGNE